MINLALHLSVILLATFSGLKCSSIQVALKPSSNFSLTCDERWVPACAECQNDDLTFPNYCHYYKYRAQEDDLCKFQSFGVCEIHCHRKKCSNEKQPLCARCGFQELSFRNKCEFNNFNCLYKNTCVEKDKGYCKGRKGKIIHQKFFEKSEVAKYIFTEKNIFDLD